MAKINTKKIKQASSGTRKPVPVIRHPGGRGRCKKRKIGKATVRVCTTC